MVRQSGDHDKGFRTEAGLLDMHPEFSHVEEFRHLLVGFHVHPRGSLRAPPPCQMVFFAQGLAPAKIRDPLLVLPNYRIHAALAPVRS